MDKVGQQVESVPIISTNLAEEKQEETFKISLLCHLCDFVTQKLKPSKAEQRLRSHHSSQHASSPSSPRHEVHSQPVSSPSPQKQEDHSRPVLCSHASLEVHNQPVFSPSPQQQEDHSQPVLRFPASLEELLSLPSPSSDEHSQQVPPYTPGQGNCSAACPTSIPYMADTEQSVTEYMSPGQNSSVVDHVLHSPPRPPSLQTPFPTPAPVLPPLGLEKGLSSTEIMEDDKHSQYASPSSTDSAGNNNFQQNLLPPPMDGQQHTVAECHTSLLSVVIDIDPSTSQTLRGLPPLSLRRKLRRQKQHKRYRLHNVRLAKFKRKTVLGGQDIKTADRKRKENPGRHVPRGSVRTYSTLGPQHGAPHPPAILAQYALAASDCVPPVNSNSAVHTHSTGQVTPPPALALPTPTSRGHVQLAQEEYWLYCDICQYRTNNAKPGKAQRRFKSHMRLQHEESPQMEKQLPHMYAQVSKTARVQPALVLKVLYEDDTAVLCTSPQPVSCYEVRLEMPGPDTLPSGSSTEAALKHPAQSINKWLPRHPGDKQLSAQPSDQQPSSKQFSVQPVDTQPSLKQLPEQPSIKQLSSGKGDKSHHGLEQQAQPRLLVQPHQLYVQPSNKELSTQASYKQKCAQPCVKQPMQPSPKLKRLSPQPKQSSHPNQLSPQPKQYPAQYEQLSTDHRSSPLFTEQCHSHPPRDPMQQEVPCDQHCHGLQGTESSSKLQCGICSLVPGSMSEMFHNCHLLSDSIADPSQLSADLTSHTQGQGLNPVRSEARSLAAPSVITPTCFGQSE